MAIANWLTCPSPNILEASNGFVPASCLTLVSCLCMLASGNIFVDTGIHSGMGSSAPNVWVVSQDFVSFSRLIMI